MQNFFKKQNGFSILEIIIVIFIITMGLVGVLSLAVQNIKASNFNKNELIASTLAQEGLEMVRNRRDENWLIGSSFCNDLGCTGNNTFTIDYSRNTASIPNINESGANLKIKDGFYGHPLSGGTATPFYRLITVIFKDAGYLEVQSRVMWKEKGQKFYYTATTDLYDWK